MCRAVAAGLALAIFFAVHAGAVPGGDAPEPPRFLGNIVVGATFPLSGPFETYGQSAYYGAVTRARIINEQGGINGKRLILEWRDNRGDPEQAVRDIDEFSRKFGVPLVLGPLLDEATMAVRPVAYRLGVVILSPLATIDAAIVGNPWIFRTCFTNTAQADALIRFQMDKYGAKTCGILYDPRYAFSEELKNIFHHKFILNGGDVTGIRSIIGPDGEKDYAAALAGLAEKGPDFIFAPCYALEATEIIRAAREHGVGIRFCGPDTWDNELVFDASGSRLAGTAFASALFEQTFSYRPFQIFFNALEQAGMDNPDAQAACAYDAVSMLAIALTKGETPELAREGLLEIKRLNMATGRLTMMPNGNPLKPVLIRVVEKRDGQLVPVFAERYDP